MSKSYAFLAIFFGLAFISCFRDPGFPAVPKITYKGIAFIKKETEPSFIEVKLNFTDGDGDLGLGVGDTSAPFQSDEIFDTLNNVGVQRNPNYFNFNVDYLFKKPDGLFKKCEESPDSCIERNRKELEILQVRFGDLNPGRTRKPISGELTVRLNFLLRNSYVNGRTLKLKVSIKDRSLNQSNEIETDSVKIE